MFKKDAVKEFDKVQTLLTTETEKVKGNIEQLTSQVAALQESRTEAIASLEFEKVADIDAEIDHIETQIAKKNTLLSDICPTKAVPLRRAAVKVLDEIVAERERMAKEAEKLELELISKLKETLGTFNKAKALQKDAADLVTNNKDKYLLLSPDEQKKYRHTLFGNDDMTNMSIPKVFPLHEYNYICERINSKLQVIGEK